MRVGREGESTCWPTHFVKIASSFERKGGNTILGEGSSASVLNIIAVVHVCSV